MKTILNYEGYFWGISLEFKLEDFWIGLYWKTGVSDIDLWLCIVPCFPIHYWSGREEK